jgi:hypothetical protein
MIDNPAPLACSIFLKNKGLCLAYVYNGIRFELPTPLNRLLCLLLVPVQVQVLVQRLLVPQVQVPPVPFVNACHLILT